MLATAAKVSLAAASATTTAAAKKMGMTAVNVTKVAMPAATAAAAASTSAAVGGIQKFFTLDRSIFNQVLLQSSFDLDCSDHS